MADDQRRTPVDAVREFLRDSGYPLEMQVARAFQRERFYIQQGWQYVDDAGAREQLRDLDVLATYHDSTRLNEPRGWKELYLVIECKRSPAPWVLFIGDELFTNSEHHFASLDLIEYAGGRLAEARAADEMPVISYTGPLAYRVSYAGGSRSSRRDGDASHRVEPTFAAVQQVNSAAMGVKRDLSTPEQYEHENEDSEPAVIVIVPVIVTDAPLVECQLDANGDMALTQVEKGLLLTRLRAEELFHSVWIVNELAVPDFAAAARTTAKNMRLFRAD